MNGCEGMPGVNNEQQSAQAESGSNQAKEACFRKLRKIGDLHTDLTAELFLGEANKTGLCIFEDYDKRSDNILTSVGLGNSTVLHTILNNWQYLDNPTHQKNKFHTIPANVQEFLECLIIKYHELLAQPNNEGSSPLDSAALKDIPVLFIVINLTLPDDVVRQLPIATCPAKNGNGTAKTCILKLPERLQSYFSKGQSDNSSAALSSKECVHITVKVDELQKWNAQLRETVMAALGRTAACCHGTSATSSILHGVLQVQSFDKSRSIINTENFQHLIEICPKEILESVDDGGCNPLHKAILLYEKENIDFERLHKVILSLVQRCPSSIYRISGGQGNFAKQTPYAMLQAMNPRRQLVSVSTRAFTDDAKIDSWDKTMKLLKYACIGGKLEIDAKKIYLYGNLQHARDIHLALTDSCTIDQDYIINLSDRVKFDFDSALEYVSLRRDQPIPYHLGPVAWDGAAPERNPYKGVFDWLHIKRNVDKIFKIVIEDLVPFPHTDEAIKAALKPFQIEIWDWRKLDICSQTIFEAAPGTRELYLQCSGNEAVLQSWACRHDGLAKFKQLKFVTVIMHANLRETREECDKLFNNFKESLSRWRPDMKDSIHRQWAGVFTNQDGDVEDITSSFGPYQSDHIAWIQTMDPFVQFLRSTIENEIEIKLRANEKRGEAVQMQIIEEMGEGGKRFKSPAYASIALIDNGVYSAAEDIPLMVKGKSWYGQRNSRSVFRDYFTGPSRHGTQMAQCICKVFPMAQLYVARLDDSMPSEKLTVDSAIKAIEWATGMDVDIISMSWTFHEREATSAQKEAFKRAIQNAYNKDIILLSSLNDTEMTQHKELLPVGLNEVIRIGSATKWGEKAETSKDGWAHYLFPAKDIPIPMIEGSGGEMEVISGSSVATAIAAGLAGLIIYTGRAMSHLSADDNGGAYVANSREKIMGVFNVLSGRLYNAKPSELFVGPGNHFPKDVERRADEMGKVHVLSSFLSSLQLRN